MAIQSDFVERLYLVSSEDLLATTRPEGLYLAALVMSTGLMAVCLVLVRLRLLADLIAMSDLASYPSLPPSMPNHSFSLILPAFNEAQNLSATVENAVSALSNIVPELEILIVDDGSTDATAEVCDRLASRHPVVRIIRHPRNRGYGAALQSGFAAARYDLVFFTDSDGQFRFGQVAEFIAQVDAVHMVLGYRAGQDRWLRKVSCYIGNWLARTLLGVRVRDINCAYKLFHRHFLQQLPLMSEGAMINTELLALAAQAGWTFHEIAVAHYPRKSGAATGAKFQVIVRTIAEYFQLQRRIVGFRRS